MTKDEIIDKMVNEMPFRLNEHIRPYVREAMSIYAEQEVNNCTAFNKQKVLFSFFVKKAKNIIDPNIGSIILHYTTYGCMAEKEELDWVGIIESVAEKSSQGAERYQVRIIGYNDKSLEQDVPCPTKFIHKSELCYKREGFQIIFD